MCTKSVILPNLCLLLFAGVVFGGTIFLFGLKHSYTQDVTQDKDALFPVRTAGKVGFIDRTGVLKIPAQFEYTLGFSDGLAAVQMGERWGFIGGSGEWRIEPLFFDVSSFSNGFAAVHSPSQSRDKYKTSVIDINGASLIDGLDGSQGNFYDGLMAVQKEGMWGFIDLSGKFVIPLQYDYATYFSNGLALVRKGDHWFYIDKNGDLKLDKAGANFSEGLAAISIESGLYTQLCGFMDTKGRLVIPYRFEEVGDFHEGFARFRSREKWGYVDKTGKIVVRALYDTADDFSEGLAAVTLNGKSGYINGSGVVRIALQYDHAESFANGMANVSRSGMELYITNTQEIVWPKSLRTGKKE